MVEAFSLPALGDALGFVAGSILMVSGAPALWELLRGSHSGSPGERRSRVWMGLGNALWVVAGLLTGVASVAVMCGLNGLIQLAIWRIMTRRARGRA